MRMLRPLRFFGLIVSVLSFSSALISAENPTQQAVAAPSFDSFFFSGEN
jgi:hypothetical protein